jgi:hypothetical protein
MADKPHQLDYGHAEPSKPDRWARSILIAIAIGLGLGFLAFFILAQIYQHTGAGLIPQ